MIQGAMDLAQFTTIEGGVGGLKERWVRGAPGLGSFWEVKEMVYAEGR